MYRRNCFAQRPKIVNVDFGKVPVATTTVKTVQIFNESCREQQYDAQRDPTTNPLDHTFNLREYTWTLEPGETFSCDIRYRPFVPFSENVDYFTITDSTGALTRVNVRGSSIGPEVSSSADKVVMVCPNDKAEIRKRIKLANASDVAATFMFDIDTSDKRKLFKVEPTHGRVEPRSRKHVTITFAPSVEGAFAYNLNCLIHHQSPVVIKLYGYRGAVSCGLSARNFLYPEDARSGFHGYTSDVIGLTSENLPLLSFSREQFDFGRADADTENVSYRSSQVVCLTNHSQENFSVAWSEDARSIFTVTPRSATVRANGCILFEMTFRPDAKEALFARELVALVSREGDYPNDRNVLEFPLSASIRMIGHSFPARSHGWIPQYEIPHTVTMPACVPPCPAYTTFLIKRFGHLPLTFRFVPPPETHFVVKPMLGMILGDFQVVVLKMSPEREGEHAYVERWAVQFNGNPSNESYVDFRGYAEYANVRFDSDNVLSFAPVYNGCEQTQQLIMRNVTRHAIMYRFLDVPSELGTQLLCGEIVSNDILSVEWTFRPTEIGEYEFQIQCALTATRNGTPIGSEVVIPLRAFGRSEVGSLVVVPDELDFGIQGCNDTSTRCFHVFNFHSISIHFKMSCVRRDWPLLRTECDVEVQPSLGTIFPGGNERISVSVTPRTPGYHQLAVRYFVRINSRENVVVSQPPTIVCLVNCMCELPTLKVTDVQCCGPSRIMNKDYLWETMKVNRINAIFKDILPDERKEVSVDFHPMILHDSPVRIVLFARNTSGVIMTWALKKIEPRERGVASAVASHRSKERDCTREEACSIYPASGSLQAKECTTITIELRYILLGRIEVKWDLDVGLGRHVLLNMTIESYSGTEKRLCLLHGNRFDLGRVYFGDKDPAYQMCWMYNGTDDSVPYAVDENALRDLNEAYGSELYECVTPRGIVQPRSSKPIILRLRPRETGVFETTLPVTLGDSETGLIIQGESSCVPIIKHVGGSLLDEPRSKIERIPVYFNTDRIELSPVPTHNRVTRMLVIYNNSKHDVLAYEWRSYELPGILRASFHPAKGRIQPGSIHTLRVIIDTGGYPCKINANVPCEFINVSELREYQRSVLKHDILCKELDGQFTITEKGVTVPKPWIEIPKKPEPFYKVITIRCDTYGLDDESLKVSLNNRLKHSPPNEIKIDRVKAYDCKEEDGTHKISLFILEGMLWNLLNDRVFQSTMYEATETNVYYSQFKMNLWERKRLIRRSYTRPPLSMIGAILEKMLFIIVHEEFVLDTLHLISQTDIRHRNFVSGLSEANDKMYNNGSNDILNEAKMVLSPLSLGCNVAYTPLVDADDSVDSRRQSAMSISFAERSRHYTQQSP